MAELTVVKVLITRKQAEEFAQKQLDGRTHRYGKMELQQLLDAIYGVELWRSLDTLPKTGVVYIQTTHGRLGCLNINENTVTDFASNEPLNGMLESWCPIVDFQKRFHGCGL